jgi:hypothetical protein
MGDLTKDKLVELHNHFVYCLTGHLDPGGRVASLTDGIPQP